MYLQPQTIHKHSLTEITELAAIFGGMLTVATWWTYDSNRRYGIWVLIQICGHYCQAWAALRYSARRYDSVICCSKMLWDAFLSVALYEADKLLEKFASALRECACLQDGGRSRWRIADVCFILLVCVIWELTASIFVYVCFVDCCISANR